MRCLIWLSAINFKYDREIRKIWIAHTVSNTGFQSTTIWWIKDVGLVDKAFLVIYSCYAKKLCSPSYFEISHLFFSKTRKKHYIKSCKE